MKRLILTFKNSKEIERVEVEVPDPEPTELEKLQGEVAAMEERIHTLEVSKVAE